MAQVESLKKIRVFIASPGDVRDERNLAREVIGQIRSERGFRNRISIEVVAWDQPGAGVPMEAGLTPQAVIEQGLPKPSECDIVIGIVWSRLGTPLPVEDYTKPDGTQYLSGTEWEILDGLEAARAQGEPRVWIYRHTKVPSLELDDPEFEEKRVQWTRVKQFFKSFQDEEGTLKGGINSYDSPTDFRKQFEQHLRDRLTQIVEHLPQPQTSSEEAESVLEPAFEGNPYPGLEAFTVDQAAIFFGRGIEVDDLLVAVAESEHGFVCVEGGSGSGKSSLVRAGVIPRLRGGALPGSDHWLEVTFKPGERGGDPFLALAYPLKQTLGISGVSEQSLADELRAEPNALIERVKGKRTAAGGASTLLLFVDQFEELFPRTPEDSFASTEPSRAGPADEVQAFTALLAAAAMAPETQVIATLRSDFREHAVEDENLSLLLRGNGTFTLRKPGVGAMREMIVRPARLAGVKVEEALVERLLDDTAKAPGGLALLAFALSELYQESGPSGRLQLNDYVEVIGGVDGAIKRRAEAAISTQGHFPQRALARLFEELVEVDYRDVATRRRAALEPLRSDPETARLLKALLEARLLVTPEDTDPPQVEVAHEAVFRAWPRLERWIEDNADKLRLLRSLELSAKDWAAVGSPRFSQLPDRATLKRYKEVERRGTDAARRYVKAGRTRQRYWQYGLVAVVLAFLTLGFNIWLISGLRTWNTLRIWGLANIGLYTGPEMFEIRLDEPGFPAEFEMGSTEYEDEMPVHPIHFAKSFAIGRYEITFDEYGAYTLDEGLDQPGDSNWGAGRRPVINVSWDEIQGYIDWLKTVTGKPFRLPSEAEWEYTARARTETAYWWGPEIGENRANCDGCDSRWDKEHTAPVGSFEANAFGLYDTAGNVFEWVEDCWHENYENAPVDGSAWLEVGNGNCYQRVIRGGSWGYEPDYLRSAGRYRYDRFYADYNVGFRLAQDLPD